MSSTVTSTNFELENYRQAGSYATETPRPNASGNRVNQNRISANLDSRAINPVNPKQDFVVFVLTALTLFCIIASCTCLIGWLFYSIGVELSSWRLQDFAQAIQGHRFN